MSNRRKFIGGIIAALVLLVGGGAAVAVTHSDSSPPSAAHHSAKGKQPVKPVKPSPSVTPAKTKMTAHQIAVKIGCPKPIKHSQGLSSDHQVTCGYLAHTVYVSTYKYPVMEDQAAQTFAYTASGLVLKGDGWIVTGYPGTVYRAQKMLGGQIVPSQQ